MDGGSASIHSDRPPIHSLPSSPSSITEQIRVLFAYADDQGAKVSLLKSILRKQQESYIPPEIPRDLILEAKIRIGDDKKASATRLASLLALECSPSDEDRRQQIIQVEKNLGRILSDDEFAAVLASPESRDNSRKISDINVGLSPSPDLKFVKLGSSSSSDLNILHAPKSTPRSTPLIATAAGICQSTLLEGTAGGVASVQSTPGPSIAASAAETCPNQILDAVSAPRSSSLNVKSDSFRSAPNPHADPSAADSKTAAWSSLFSSQVGRARDLTLHTKPSTDPDHHVEFDEADSMEAVQNWGNSLVGYFIGNTPPTHDIKVCLEKAWRIRNLEIIPMAEGYFLFKFVAFDIGQRIIDDGPWFVYGHPLILQRWSADINMCRQNLASIPIWVRLPNLNFCFRSKSALSKIASVIGTPICMDHATAAGTRYAFARVCVEIDVDAALPSELRMKYKEKTIIQRVEYAWKPNPCKTCRTFNHGDKSCPLKVDTSKPERVWVPKKIQEHPTSDMNNGTEISQNNSHDEEHHTVQVSPNDPLKGTLEHDGWTVVKENNPSGKSRSSTESPTKNVSGLAPGLLNRFSSLSNLDGEADASLEKLAATTPSTLNTSSIDASCPILDKKLDKHPPTASISSNVETHRFLSLSNLDGDSNVPEAELLTTTALVLQGSTAFSPQINSDDQKKSLFSKGFLSRVPSSSSSVSHKPKPAGPTIT